MKLRLFCAFCISVLAGVCVFGQTPRTDASGIFGSPVAGGGSVTTVSSGNLSPIFTTSVSNPTTTPAISFTLNTQSANLGFFGPTTGVAAAPTWRAMVIADLPTGIPNANLANPSATINNGTGISGGGTLTLGSSLTLSVTADTTTQRVRASKGGTLVGTRQEINFVEGANQTITCADDSGNNRVNCTFAAAGGSGSPGGSNGQVQVNSSGAFAGISIFTYASGFLTIAGRLDISTSSDSVRPLAVSIPATSSFGAGEFQVNGTTFALFSPRRTLNLSTISDPSAVNGDVWTSGDTNTLSYFAGGAKHSMAGTLFTASNSRSLVNSSTETSLLPSGVGTLTLAANYLLTGKTICWDGLGYWSTQASPGTFQYKVKLGGTTIMSTAASTPNGSLSDKYVHISGCFTCRTTGSSGTVIGQGDVISRDSNTTNTNQLWEMVSTATATINTTTTNAFDITGQWGSGSTTNSLTITNFRLWVNN